MLQEETIVMTTTNKLNIKNYCNTLYTELEGVKSTLNGFIQQIEGFSGEEAEHVRSHADHLRKIVETIDWKLEIFTKACPLESGSYDKGAVSGASVPLGEGEEFSGGYAGG
jgi:hypothetical protein